MIRTTLMIDRYAGTHKTFSHMNVAEKANKRLSLKDRFTMVKDLNCKTGSLKYFDATKNKVYLDKPNEIFHLNHVIGNVDIVLPKPEKFTDWVLLFYDQDQSIFNIAHETHSKIKIYGNGERIMGYDEPMICDIPFMSLRLTYVNKPDGWIIT